MNYVFVDLDGTLADTDRDIRLAWKAALADLHLVCPDFDARFVAGPPIDEMVKTLFPDAFTPALADAIRTRFADHYDTDGFPTTREYPGVLDEMRRIKSRGDFCAIVTNKRFVGATAMARHFGWDRVFDGLYAGDMYASTIGKLAKGALLKRLIDALGAPRAACVMVGDTASDFRAAAECGIRSIAVTWGYGTDEERARANAVVARAEEITPVLRALTGEG